MKFERTQIELDVYGTVYKLSRPTFKRALEIGEECKEKSELEVQELMINLLEELGLPKEVTMGMEIDHVGQIFNYLMPSKKK